MEVLEKRFLAKVFKEDGDGCWVWVGAAPIRGGYGTIRVGNRAMKAHRLSYEIYKGPIPAGMNVCHKCDHPYCVKPDHLFLGTHADNMRDMLAKGRQGKVDPVLHAEISKEIWSSHSAEERKARIEAVSRALKDKPFTPEHLANLRTSPANQKGREVRFIPERKIPLHRVLDILQRYAAGATQEGLAKEFNVSHSVIGKIIRGSFIERESGYGTRIPADLHDHGNTGVVRSEEQKAAHSTHMKKLWAAGRFANKKKRDVAAKPVVEKVPFDWAAFHKQKWADMTPEQKAARAVKIAASKTGTKLSEEHKEKIRQSHIGMKKKRDA